MSALSLKGLPGDLTAQARRLAWLRDRLVAALGGQEGAHVVGVSLHGNRLTVFADSPAWCMRLRYRAPELEATVQSLLGQRPQIRFRVQPPAFTREPAPRRALPESAVAALDAAARSIEKGGAENGPLAAALRRLAGHDG